MLQAWALKTVLEGMGHSVSFPICNHVGETSRWLPWIKWSKNPFRLVRSFVYRLISNLMSIGAEGVAQRRYKAFRLKYLPEKVSDPNELHKVYDMLVYGSDQIWRAPIETAEEQALFFAESVNEQIPKIAYAASYDDKPLEDPYAERLRAAVGRFKQVSVRERLVAEQIEGLTGIRCPIVLDPTLLLSKESYCTLDCGCAPQGDYLFVYTLAATPFVVSTARNMARRLGLRLVLAPVYQYSRYGAPRGLTYGISPDRLVAYIAHARYVMSYSFHGTVFSVIFGKQFLDLRNATDEYETRSGSLLRQLGMTDRMVNPTHDIDDILCRLRSPLPSDVQDRLSKLRHESLAWLKDAIEQSRVGNS